MQFGKIKFTKKDAKEVIEQKFSQIDGTTGNGEDSWGQGERDSAGYPK